MPIIKSAIKQNRKNVKNRARNDARKLAVRKAIKTVEKGVSAKDAAAVKAGLSKAASLIDKLTKKNLIHKNTAARRKSKLMRMANAATK